MTDKVELMPPSCFSAPSQSDPWQALSEATKQILALKNENQSLLKKRSEEQEAQQRLNERSSRIEPVLLEQRLPYQAPPQQPYHDSIINRQAHEIETLKLKLHEDESKHIKKVTGIEHQLALHNSTSQQQLKCLQDEVSSLQQKLKAEGQLRTELENKQLASSKDRQLQHEQEAETLRLNLQQVKLAAEQEKAELNKQLCFLREEQQTKCAEYEQQIQSLNETFCKEEEECSKLRLYLTQAQGLTQSSHVLKEQNNSLNNKIQAIEEEKRHLQSTLELLNIRLQSQQEILTLHEEQLSKTTGAKVERQNGVLLTRWREKVYELLVKLRCSELVYKDEMRKFNDKLWESDECLKTSRMEHKRLQLALNDKQAQLDIEIQKSKALENDLTHAQQIALSLDDNAERDLNCVAGLKQTIDSALEMNKRVEEQMEDSVKHLFRFSQRLDFASGRIEMLQGQFARREAMLRLERPPLEEPAAAAEQIHQQQPHRDSDLVGQLEEELALVRQERDALASQIKADAEFLHRKIGQATEKSAAEAEHLRKQLLSIHEEKDRQAEESEEIVDNLREENQHLIDTVEELRSGLARATVDAEQLVEAERGGIVTQLADMQTQVNETRRQHAKAVVMVRQAERRHGREQDRWQQQVASLREQHAAATSKLEARVQQLQRTKNILTTTLQQEGLLGRVRAARGAVIQLSESDDERDDSLATNPTLTSVVTGQGASQIGHCSREKSSSGPQEPLHVVIDELKHLTEAITQDVSDSDLEDQEGHNDSQEDLATVNSDLP